MNFKNFLSNEKIKEQISVLLETSRFPHAIILEGEDGIGKRTLAREIAEALVCRSNDEKPCGECSQCKKAILGVHPDIYEYSPEGSAKSFHKDVVKHVIEDSAMTPNEAEYKIYILANAQYMSESAQNAILKILEEPPSYVRFIITVNNKGALLQTVLSRSVVFSLQKVKSEDAANYIVAKDESVSYDDAYQAAQMSGGNIGKAIESLKDGKSAKLSEICNNFCLALLDDNEYELIKVCSAFQKDRQGIVSACNVLTQIFHDALMFFANKDFSSSNDSISKILARKLTKEKLLLLIETVSQIKKEAEMNANNAIIITKFCYALREDIGR